MSDAAQLARREGVSARLKAGLSVWFKRGAYNQRGNYSTRPLWHRLERVEVTETYSGGAVAKETWQALCGYAFEVQPWIFGSPDTKNDVKTAKIRCTKCTKLSERLITS